MIIATAGHIDHGKTALVKALTGVDTDRLPEEKARGISIDLGFAYWTSPGGKSIGFVDVPGHERFVRNMLAGVCAIDYVMLVVAADDGVMPQTIEHLHIVDLLSVRNGIAVITKADRVSAERIAQVIAEIRSLLASTGLEGIPVLAVSALTGDGIDALRDVVARAADARPARVYDQRNFRYAIDRAFTIAGSGTVVTGTVFDGTVAVGDRLTLSPGGLGVRVRGIEKAGSSSQLATIGERAALNLAAVDLQHIGRGDWIVAVHSPTLRIDARLTLLRDEAQALRHWSPVHLHLGAASVNARVAIPGGKSIQPSESRLVQLIADKPLVAVAGDRFIIRNQSATRTIGGGVVVDPLSPMRRGNAAVRSAQLRAMETLDPERVMPALLDASPAGVDLDAFARSFNLRAEYVQLLAAKCAAVLIERTPILALSRANALAVMNSVVEFVTRFHADQPQAVGVDAALLRAQCAPALRVDDFVTLTRGFAAATGLEVVNGAVRRVSHVSTANRADDILWQRVKPLLDDAGLRGILVRDLAADLKLGEALLKDLLHRKSPMGDVFRVSPERFYPRGVLARFAALAQALAAKMNDQGFTAAQFRDASGVNRTLAIEVLECLDRLGITQRIGDARKMRKDFEPILGRAESVPTAAKVTAPRMQSPERSRPAAAGKRFHSFKL